MLSDRTPRAEALANTYTTIDGRTGWARVQQYQRVLEYRGDHPEAGSQAVATALDLPRSRIRPWFSGAKPDPVHAIQTAEANDWLDTRPGERTFEALSVLTAWLFAGGSLGAAQFVPLFAVGDDDPRGLGESALQAVGTGAQCHRADSDARATELQPAKTASHLGRFLHAVMGAPLGQKAEQPALALPGWLETVGASTQLRWARTYVTVRGTAADPAHGYDCQLREARPQSYLAGLGRLFQSLAPPETVTTGSQTVRLRPAATRELNTVPDLPPAS